MANVNIKFNGKEYLLSCEDGQEEHLEELSLLSLIHISEPTRLRRISYAVFCLKKNR